VHRLNLVPWQDLPARIRDVDVNLAPLSPGSPFNEAKSAIKWLEAALVATPTVASPTQPFREAIDDGVTGLLAESRADWRRQIERLLDDVALRRTIGERARRAALLTWGPPAQGRRYRAILDAAADLVDDPGRARPLAPQQDKEFTDEPPASIRFAPYSAQIRRLRRGRPDRIAPAWRRYPTAVRRILRDEGTAGIVGRVVRSMRAGLRKVRDMLRLSGS
jgi:hypothetical protein